MKNFSSFLRVCVTSLCVLATGAAQADRVKDLATLAAQRPNQLIGYGLVVGLQGTGDDASVPFTTQSMKAMLSQMGVRIDGPLTDFETAATAARVDIKNTAAVLVTADLPGFSKPGQRIDINVSAIGKASSLRGGSLIMTAMRGVDGEIYALAQGALTATGIDVSAAGSKVQIGVPTSARIPGGAIVERIVDTPFESAENVIYNIRENDFSTTTAIVNAINKKFGGDVAQAIDGVSVSVRAPQNLNQRVAFMSMIEALEVTPGEPPARVVINSRTGTVVINRSVRVTAAAVSHGTISVAITATNEVSQPNMLAGGQTTEVQNADIKVAEPNKPMFLFQPGVELRQIVDAVNQVGATPSALIAILEALKSSGSLRAELVII
ncbi:flagellar biosynthesis protein FlgI [Limnohabitans sp. Rim8]|uniref:Flagellar P-ring protein n=1 Tax=Limnohabitans curvus TaxID=323423 RepID=A0A315ERE8_9BURK|nr:MULTISPECIES: flagellar basal body P-ring protein FlgI [Limnohabitans]PUE56603.1 flagellar biosynthesis protein FlgI [Limnohabitans sp. Rim8]PUE59821.1 flagellar biosynthesis protein FlgI [Limnohabitans curvus]BDU52220.1 flagellar P-ring protein [Limnohabitans sp. INBF002]